MGRARQRSPRGRASGDRQDDRRPVLDDGPPRTPTHATVRRSPRTRPRARPRRIRVPLPTAPGLGLGDRPGDRGRWRCVRCSRIDRVSGSGRWSPRTIRLGVGEYGLEGSRQGLLESPCVVGRGAPRGASGRTPQVATDRPERAARAEGPRRRGTAPRPLPERPAIAAATSGGTRTGQQRGGCTCS